MTDNIGTIFTGEDQNELFKTFNLIMNGTLETPYSFPSSLNPTQRKYIHEFALRFGLVSKSVGEGVDRHITISLKPREEINHKPVPFLLNDKVKDIAENYLFKRNSKHSFLKDIKSKVKNNRNNHTNSNSYLLTKDQQAKLSKDLRKQYNLLQNNGHYLNILKERTKLPAYQMHDEIIDTINKNQVTIITGETGCGKTTQIPQIILDDYIINNKGGQCKILVTQPRRISATSVAKRVAYEYCSKVGNKVGYHIRLNRNCNKFTSIIFATVGIILRKMINNPSLNGITHLILDEVHEREILCDFLITLIKSNLLIHCPHIKIILMSATINPTFFYNILNKIM